MGYLVGDCLMAAAFLSYAGPFLSHYRDELVQDTWLKQVYTCVREKEREGEKEGEGGREKIKC